MMLLALLSSVLLGLPASDSIVPKKWLVIEPVNRAGRRPLRPDAVFARHLLARDAPPPKKGELLRGEDGKSCVWQEATVKDDGSLEGQIGWAYTAIESALEDVWMAKLSGASQLYVNGTGFVGDAYLYGFGGVPIALRKGRNDVYVGGVRRPPRLELWKPENKLFVASWDQTIAAPRKLEHENGPGCGASGVLVVNAGISARDYCLTLEEPGTYHPWDNEFPAPVHPVMHRIPPLALEKVPVPSMRTWKLGAPPVRIQLELPTETGSELLALQPSLRGPAGSYRGTFLSGEDDSVQEFGVRPATEREQGVVLSLHGLGADCMNQIGAYSPKPDLTLIAPSNRRPNGLDWQDWGRTNVYETLVAAKGALPATLYLTGQSMGGHGTWSLAANDPDIFAAIAPCAGWSSFDSYGEGRPKGELAELWQDADASSRTLALIANLAQLPTFILHGTADDTVPISESKLMEKALADAGHPPKVHYQQGAGHWWDGDETPGVDCVDWPGIWELFRSSKPRAPSPETHFTTVDPGVDAGNGWLTVLQLERYGQPAEVKSSLRESDRTLVVETKNVRRLHFGAIPGEPKKIVVDGKEFVPDPPPRARDKSPDFSGPFKRAFRRHFVLVYGTGGTPEENRELYERARCDSEVWWYRGNGRGRLLSDVEYLALTRSDSNAILYGNADTNLVWKERVAANAPIQVRRGSLKLGEREWKGDDLCALVVYPSSQEGELLGLVGSTGATGTRLSYTTAYFLSGVGYPDYTLFGPAVLQKGDGGVLAAGWFDAAWELDGHGVPRPDAK